MRQIDWRAIGAAIVLYGLFGGALFVCCRDAIMAAENGWVCSYCHQGHSFSVQYAFFWADVLLNLASIPFSALVLTIASYGVSNRLKYGNFYKNGDPSDLPTRETVAPLINDTKHSHL